MLKLPRKTHGLKTSHRRNKIHPYVFPPLHGSVVVYLTKAAKISWAHFEAIRLKFSRIITAKRKASKKTWFKQQRGKEVRRSTYESKVKKHGTIWYNGFPHLPHHSKGRGSRMGKGKGNIKYWYFNGKPFHKIMIFKHQNSAIIKIFITKIVCMLPCKSYWNKTKNNFI
jgi:ribosomal protein L16/L10AE